MSAVQLKVVLRCQLCEKSTALTCQVHFCRRLRQEASRQLLPACQVRVVCMVEQMQCFLVKLPPPGTHADEASGEEDGWRIQSDNCCCAIGHHSLTQVCGDCNHLALVLGAHIWLDLMGSLPDDLQDNTGPPPCKQTATYKVTLALRSHSIP